MRVAGDHSSQKMIRPFIHSIERHFMANPTATTFDHLPDTGYLRQAQLIPHVVPFSSATLWRKCKTGQFPQPVRLSERVTAWRVGDVRAWLVQAQERTTAGASA